VWVRCLCLRTTHHAPPTTNLETLLSTDVGWQTMISRITADLPPGISLTGFQGQVTPPVPVAAALPVTPTPADASSSGSSSDTTTTTPTAAPPPPAPTINGAVTFQGKAKDYPTLASWIDSMGKVPQIFNIYVTGAQKAPSADNGSSSGLTFTATAVLTPAAQSNRLNLYVKAAK